MSMERESTSSRFSVQIKTHTSDNGGGGIISSWLGQPHPFTLSGFKNPWFLASFTSLVSPSLSPSSFQTGPGQFQTHRNDLCLLTSPGTNENKFNVKKPRCGRRQLRAELFNTPVD